MEALLKKNQEAELMIQKLTAQIEILKKNGVEISKYETDSVGILKENQELSKKIAAMKNELIKTELINGEIQVDLPVIVKNTKAVVKTEESKLVENPNVIKPVENVEPVVEKLAKESKPKADKKTKESVEVIDVSRFDMRIGKILEVTKHGDADGLYIEKVDVGEAKPRTIISGLVKYCTEADLLGRMAIFLINLKPAKMRGVLSEGMIMCASAPEQGIVEPLTVPEGVKPGDRVTVEGYNGTPDDVMNPKKKILETVKPELIVDGEGVATYRGAKWQVNGQVGVIKSTNLKNVQIA